MRFRGGQAVAFAVLMAAGRAQAATDPIDTAGPLVAKLIEGTLLEGKPLGAKDQAALDSAMRTLDRRYRGAPLSNPSARRYDALLALAKGFSAASLGSPRVAAALVELSAQGDLVARAASGALVWQATRAVGAAQQSSAPVDELSLALARAYVPACPGPFAKLTGDAVPDPFALRAALPYCEAGTSTAPLAPERSLAREIVRRVLGAANEARERLASGKEGLGPWRPAFDRLERELASGVPVPYEAAVDGTVEGVTLPDARPRAPVPGGALVERIVGADGVHQVAAAPRIVVSGGILAVEDGPPAQRIARLSDPVGPVLEAPPLAAPDLLLVLADGEATVGSLLSPAGGPGLPAAPLALGLLVRDPAGGFGIITVERGRGLGVTAPVELSLDLKRAIIKVRLKGSKRAGSLSFARADELAALIAKLTGAGPPPTVFLAAPAALPVRTLIRLATALSSRLVIAPDR